MAIFYPLALALGGEALVSITRVEEFLLADDPVIHTSNADKTNKNDTVLIAVKHNVQHNGDFI